MLNDIKKSTSKNSDSDSENSLIEYNTQNQKNIK